MLSTRDALLCMLILILVSAGGVRASGQTKLMANDAAAFDLFGIAVAISGDTVVVGANSDDVGWSNAGSAYVFVREGSTWIQQAKLTASVPRALDQFGTSVAISGDTVIIGAPSDDDDMPLNGGSVYVFTRTGTTWSQQAQLLPSDTLRASQFGFSVAFWGNTVLVGAPLDSNRETELFSIW